MFTLNQRIKLLFLVKRSEQNWFGAEFKAQVLFCPMIGSDLQPYDAYSDGYDDLTCHTSNGTIAISESLIVEQRTGGVTEAQSTDESGDAAGTEYLSLFYHVLSILISRSFSSISAPLTSP